MSTPYVDPIARCDRYTTEREIALVIPKIH